MPLALEMEGLKGNPFSTSAEFAIGYNGTLAQTAIVDAWKFWYSGFALTNTSQYNTSQNSSNSSSGNSTGNVERKLAPNDGKHKGKAKGDISADPFWNNPEKGQQSLDTADSSKNTKQVYKVSDGKLVKFQPDGVGGWHAYEVGNPNKEVPNDVLRKMRDDGLISRVQYNKWINNK
jgi:hypothetical protein